MPPSSLSYEPTAAARPVLVERDGGVTRIIVPMRGPYAPVPRWVNELDFFAVIVAPAWWIATLIVRTILRLPKPPRAVFEISDDRFKMSLRDPSAAEVKSFDWPRAAVAEVRANRYEKGLWLNVPGHVKETYLSDVPRVTIKRLDAALRAALDPRIDSMLAPV
jgi:hypothetical protein